MKPTLGDAVDALARCDKRIADLNEQLRQAKVGRAEVERRLIRKLQNANLHGCKGSQMTAELKTQQIPTIRNRAKLDAFIKKHGAFDLLQNRISSKAYFDRLEEGEAIPGVDVFERTYISIRRRKK